MDDETIREKIANPLMDIVHQQVVMVLYSLDANGQLNQYKEMLPLYLSEDWSKCEAILDVIEKAGLLVRTDQGLQLTHPVRIDTTAAACGCHS